ncbi:MAG: alpha/beta fold hydrolase, partial [Opitutales bacterium]|nr:alpha/beta fold hydrolase [Opitutales bacterium]
SILNGKGEDENLPAVVCVHGGGGRAFAEWTELWASRGYAAIAIDWRGNGAEPVFEKITPELRKQYPRSKLLERKHLKNGGPEHTAQTVSLADGKPEKQAWPYFAAGAVVRAHSLIRSFKEVNPNKTAITGISWGGYLTCLVSGIDSRFKAAVPVYGCGFIYEKLDCMSWGGYIGAKTDSHKRWIELFDPSKSLEIETVPMLFVNSPNDRFYPLTIWKKSASLAKAQALIIANLKHSHEHGWNIPEIEAFISSKLNGTNSFPKIGEVVKRGNMIECNVYGAASAELFFSDCQGEKSSQYKWESVPMRIYGGVARVALPQSARSYYITATDRKGTRVSSF